MDSSRVIERIAARQRGGGGEPAAQLVVEEIWLAVVDGSLEAGERLPTARQLAVALNLSPRSIEGAYRELERRGVVASRAGSGTFVSLAPPSEQDRARHQEFSALCRAAVERADALGFSLDELLDALAEFRTAEATRSMESGQ